MAGIIMHEREVKRILIVDDEPSICTILTTFLGSLEYECEYTTDSTTALTILLQGNYELLISDIKMAGIDGLQLLTEVSKVIDGLDSIIMTGYTNAYTYSEIIKAGATDFIAKPFQTQELKAKIERIDRERKLRRELQETNVALGVLLRQSDREKDELSASIASIIKKMVLPYLDKLRNHRLNAECLACLDIVESNLAEICSPLVKKLSLQHANLSPMEGQVADMIKYGKRNKEIASILGISLNTVMTHRYRLRSKLALKGKDINLRSYLNSTDFQ
jgi:FixJ family two-component response regulator